MELIGLDLNFNPISYIPYINLQWKRRYHECGEWSAQIPASEYDPRIVHVYSPERPEVGLMQSAQSSSTTRGKYMQIGGLFLESVFDRQIAYPHITGTYKVQELARLMTTHEWYVPDVYQIYMEDSYPDKSVTVEWARKPIGGLMYETLKPIGYSMRILLDPNRNRLTIGVWCGKDRTQDQTENGYAVFSEDSSNVTKFEYHEDTSNYKNVAMILYGNGPNRYDVYAKDWEKMGRRWVLMNGNADDGFAGMEQKAFELLAKYPIIKEAKIDVIQDGLLYGVDYDIGDKCSIVSHEYQQAFDARLIEVDETWKGKQHTVSLVFGEQSLTTYQKALRAINTERAAFGYGADLNNGGSWTV